jgi:general secretion pathway protein D
VNPRIKSHRHWLHGIWLMCLVWAMPLFAQTITLNLKDADINALIGTVAEVTGKNFIVDPRVKGKVTVISSRPMDAEEVYQVFLSILKVHGFAAVPSGAVIKILPDVSAKQDSIPNVSDDAPGRGDEMVTRVIQATGTFGCLSDNQRADHLGSCGERIATGKYYSSD